MCESITEIFLPPHAGYLGECDKAWGTGFRASVSHIDGVWWCHSRLGHLGVIFSERRLHRSGIPTMDASFGDKMGRSGVCSSLNASERGDRTQTRYEPRGAPMRGGGGEGPAPPWDLKNTLFSGFLPLNYAICILEVWFLSLLLCRRTKEACRMIKSLWRLIFRTLLAIM